MSAAVAGQSTRRRRSKIAENEHDHQLQPLLPGLPDDIACLCLSAVPPSLLFSVCRSWRRLIYSPSFPPFLSLYAILSSPPPQSDACASDSVHFFTFDPISSSWHPLPPPPPNPPPSFLLHHPSFLSRSFPIQSVSVSGNLVVLAATADNFYPALPSPLVFNPIARRWAFGPPLATPRRWCAAGASGGAVVVASGIGSRFCNDVARSVEKWDLRGDPAGGRHRPRWGWQKMSALRDGRFSRDAIEAVGWRGKLCMVNVRGRAAKDGVVYDVEKDSWEEMPAGMLAGWSGPVAAMDEDVMYTVEGAKGSLWKYDPARDEWEEVVACERLRGAEQMAAGGGRVCVVVGGDEIVVVDVSARPARVWMVAAPLGLRAVAVHILPRMSGPYS